MSLDARSLRRLTALHLMQAKVPEREIKAFLQLFGNTVIVDSQTCRKYAEHIDWRLLAHRLLSWKGRKLAQMAFDRVYSRYQAGTRAILADRQQRLRGELNAKNFTVGATHGDLQRDNVLVQLLRQQYAVIFAYLWTTDTERQ
jgi:hypothetical protein